MHLHFAAPWMLAFLPVGVGWVLWARRRSYVNQTPRRRRLSTVLRILLVSLLTLTIARPMLIAPGGRPPTVLLVDVSASIPDLTLEAERAFVASAWAAREGRALEVVTFGAHPRRAAVGPQGPTIARHDEADTNFDEAIAFASGLVSDRAARLVLLSDGNDPHGRVRAAIERATAGGAQVDVVVLSAARVADARMIEIGVPEVVRRQEPTRFSVAVDSNVAGAAKVRLEENGFLVEERSVQLAAGAQSFEVEFSPTVAGLVRYAAQVLLPGDAAPANDRISRLVSVAGPPRILLVASTPEEGVHLEEALAAQEIGVESTSPSSLPSTLEGLLPYDEVILAGIAPWEPDPLRQSALASYVSDTGGGLLFVSGRRGLIRDPSGRESVLERVLPVDLVQPSEKEEPPVAIVLVIDRSGSMVGEKLEYAKQAARAVVDKLTPRDEVGVIAFDARFEWIVPLRAVDEKEAIQKAIGSLGAGGGTRFYPPLEEAYFSLGSADATVRHVVLLTDGISTDPTDVFPPLLEKARGSAITVSAVAIGHQADAKLLSEIARQGGGRFTVAKSASEVPNLFVKETETIQRDAKQQAAVQARVAGVARELSGIDFPSAPPLLGYLRTHAKASAEVLLDTPRHDPLLARWRFGLGEVAVFTSDATAAWGERWLTWSGFGKLWSQLARGLQRTRAKRDLTLQLRDDGNLLRLAVEASDAEAHLLDDLEVKARVIDGNEESHEVALAQVGPGRYAAQLAVPPGSILARPFARRGERHLDGDWAMLVRSNREIERVGADEALLSSLAELGHGRVIRQPEELFGPGSDSSLPRDLPLGVPLALATLAVFLIDLAVKRARWEARS